MIGNFTGLMPPTLAENYAASRRRLLYSGRLAEELRASTLTVAGKCVLNLAAGGGEWDVALFRSGVARVIWIDPCPEMLRHSLSLHQQQNVRSEYIRGTMENLPLASASVDAVLCHEAIYHAKSEQRACAEIWRVLRKGGVLWLRTDSIGRLSRDSYPWWKRPILACTPLLAYATGVKVLPTPFALIWLLRRTLRSCGFEELRVRMTSTAVYDFLGVKH
jgi:2-polyprenyl-3-methyl-5-hydroxy-6-metoxy-1,4-benzoquinol methylase